MAEYIADEFFIPEFTVDCIVPKFWVDGETWDDGSSIQETVHVRGIFDNDYLRLSLGTAGVDSADPQVLFKTADIPFARGGHEIIVEGVAYKVGTPQPDGDGFTLVDLVRGE